MTKEEKQKLKDNFEKKIGKRGITVYDNMQGVSYSYIKNDKKSKTS